MGLINKPRSTAQPTARPRARATHSTLRATTDGSGAALR